MYLYRKVLVLSVLMMSVGLGQIEDFNLGTNIFNHRNHSLNTNTIDFNFSRDLEFYEQKSL